MSTLLNKYYTGTYDPNLASEVETARPVVKLDAPVYHQTQATKVIWEYPWPYTQMIMAQDGKVQPEQFQGRERPSDEFVKNIVRRTQEAKRKIEREERQKPLVDSQNIDKLMKQQAMMKFINDNRNRNVQYEASLLSGEEKDQFLAQNANRDRYFGVQALDNPATKRYMQFQQDLGKYFRDVNLSLAEIADSTARAPGATPSPTVGGTTVAGSECPRPGSSTPVLTPPPYRMSETETPRRTTPGVELGVGVEVEGLPETDPYEETIEAAKEPASGYATAEEPYDTGLHTGATASERPTSAMADEAPEAAAAESVHRAARMKPETSGSGIHMAEDASARAALTGDTVIDSDEPKASGSGGVEWTPSDSKKDAAHYKLEYKKGRREGHFFNRSTKQAGTEIKINGDRHKTLTEAGWNKAKWMHPFDLEAWKAQKEATKSARKHATARTPEMRT